MIKNKQEWLKSYRHRSDVSTYLTHLTRGENGKTSSQVLKKILEDRKIIANNKRSFVVGNSNVVSFMDNSLSGVTQQTYFNFIKSKEGTELEYKPIGLTFDKKYAFAKGARPVFYEKEEVAKEILNQKEWWRIVDFDLSNQEAMIDRTMEREWRFNNDFEFDLEEVAIVIPSLSNYDVLKQSFGEEILSKVKGVVILEPFLS